MSFIFHRNGDEFAMAAIIIVCLVLYNANSTAKEQQATGKLEIANISVFSGIGTITFSYVCQHSSFIVYNSLKDKSLESWTKVSRYSILLTGIISISFAVGAYLAFRDQTEPDVLKSFHNSKFFIDFARFLLGITMIFTYPMENFVFRHCVSEINRVYIGSSLLHPHIIAFTCWIVVLLIGLSFEDLGFVFELTGSISGIAIAFIFPALCYFTTRRIHTQGVFESKFYFVCNFLMLTLGVFVMIFGTFQSISNIL